MHTRFSSLAAVFAVVLPTTHVRRPVSVFDALKLRVSTLEKFSKLLRNYVILSSLTFFAAVRPQLSARRPVHFNGAFDHVI